MEEEEKNDAPPLLDGIRVVDKPRVALIRTNLWVVIGMLVGTALLATGIAYWLTHNEPGRTIAEKVMPEPGPIVPELLATPRTVTMETVGQQGTLPPTWRVSNTPPLPNGFQNAQVTYTNAERTCYVTYAEYAVDTAATALVRSAPGDTLERAGTLHAKIERRVPAERASTSTPPTATDTAFVPDEIAFSYQPLFYDNGSRDATRNAWLLFSRNDRPIPTECYASFVSFIDSLEPFFPAHSLSPKDVGVLTIETYDSLGTLLLYTDDESGKRSVVATLDSGMIYKPTLAGNTLWYVGTAGTLRRYELFDENAAPTEVPITLQPGESVNDFVVATYTVQYLAGAWCQADPSTCNLSRYAYDPTRGTTTLEASALSLPTLTLPDPATEADSLYLERSQITEYQGEAAGTPHLRIPVLLYTPTSPVNADNF